MSEFISEFIQKKRLGQLLVEKCLLSEEQLMECLAEQQQTKEFLGQMLLRKGLVEEEALFQCLAEQMQLEYYTLEKAKKAVENADTSKMRGMVSNSYLKKNRIFVLVFSEKEMQILTSDPLNLTIKDQLAAIVKRDVIYCVCSRKTCEALLDVSKQKSREMGAKIIEQALVSPASIVEQLCLRCTDDMIFVVTEIAKKHRDTLARKHAIRKLSSFHSSALVFVFQQLLKTEKDSENLTLIRDALVRFKK